MENIQTHEMSYQLHIINDNVMSFKLTEDQIFFVDFINGGIKKPVLKIEGLKFKESC